jgi:outer membrane protein assembly factor BamD (BamD/ComL family)
MQRNMIAGLLILLVVMVACTKKKTEAEYYRMGNDQYNKEQFTDAISNFQKVLKYYPQGTNAPNAMFMIGFIYANNTKNFEEAKKYYTMFIEKYPQHELAKSAEFELKNMGQDTNLLPMFHDAEKDTAVSKSQK